MSHSLYTLSKEDSQIIKGVAILAIVAHNFLHLQSDVGVNEMGFEIEATLSLFKSIAQNPLGIINDFFSYFGAFGVQLFIFISAYGLTKKHMRAQITSYFRFLFDRIIKIYGLLIVGLLFFFIFQMRLLPLDEYIEISFQYLSMTSNLRSDTLFLTIGPWWFFGLIVQFYILFPLLFWFIQRFRIKGVAILTLVSYVAIYVLSENEDVLNFPVLGNAIGHLPEFMLGISLAMFPSLKIDWKVAVLALLVFVASCFHEAVFPLGFLAVTILMLSCLQPLLKASKSSSIVKTLIFVGNISMFIFVINGILRFRTLGWIYTYTTGGSLEILFVCIVHTLLCVAISYLVYRLYKLLADLLADRMGLSIL